MAASAMIRLVIVTALLYTISSAPYDLEADSFVDSLRIFEDRIRTRSTADNNLNLWMKKGESLTMKFCLDIESYISINNVIWSNDGWLDTVVVKIDDEVVGNFSTNDNSDWGFLWDKLNESGPIGEEMNLPSGVHTVTLEVLLADFYGLEIDKVVLGVDGVVPESGLECVKQADDTGNGGMSTDDKGKGKSQDKKDKKDKKNKKGCFDP